MRPRRTERGTMALEMAVLAPILLTLLLFLMACGRYFQTSSMLENAARDGARSATQARSSGDAQKAVDAAVRHAMEKAVDSCRDSASGSLAGAGFAPGQPVTVEVTCTINYRDLGLLGLNDDVTLTRSFTSMLDPYRGVRG